MVTLLLDECRIYVTCKCDSGGRVPLLPAEWLRPEAGALLWGTKKRTVVEDRGRSKMETKSLVVIQNYENGIKKASIPTKENFSTTL